MKGSISPTRSAPARAALAALLALFLCGALAGTAQALVPLSGSDDPLPGSNFQGGDGDQDDEGGFVDWQGLVALGAVAHYPDPNAQDSTFKSGNSAKEHSPGDWDFTTQNGGSTPGNVNIFDAWSNVDDDGETFLNLAFTRQQTNGTAYLGFELNKVAGTWFNGQADAPCRTTGDLLVTLQVNGNDVSMLLETWTSTTSDTATGCALTGTLTEFNDFTDNVDAQGAVNAATITNYLEESGPLPTGSIGPLQFGEASLNLSSLLEGALGSPCFSFGSIWMQTRSSTEFNSDMKDYIAPSPLLVRSCSASGTKYEDVDGDGVIDAGEPTIAGWKLYIDENGNDQLDAGEPTTLTDANGDYTFDGVDEGTFTIREAPDAQQAAGLKGYFCTFPSKVAANCEYAVTIDADHRDVSGRDFANAKLATVKIVKDVEWIGEPTGAAFDFAPNAGLSGNSDPAAADFQLADGETETIARVRPNNGAGDPTYTVTEVDRAGFRIGSVACDDDDSEGDAATGVADIVVEPGETVTCTFVNEQVTTGVLVEKDGPASVFHGDQITYSFSVTTRGNSPLHDVTVTDDRCAPVTGPTQKLGGDQDALLEPGETWLYSCTTTVGAHSDGEENPIHNTVTAAAKDEEDNPVSDTDDHDTTIVHPTIQVDKQVRVAGIGDYVDSGLEAYVGDKLEYRFTVTSPPPGDVGLAVTFSDPRCDAGTLTGPAGDDGDALLEPGEAWVYGCTHVIVASDPDPLPNTATATGRVPGTENPKGTVTDDDSSSVDVLHPLVNIEKTGPATAIAGAVLSYSLAVTNPGDIAFSADKVVVTDPGCDDQPALVSKNGDPTPGTLDPKTDTWTYTCSHATQAGQTSFLNVAKVVAVDRNGREATDTDDLPTTLNQAQVLPGPEIVSGSARLRGPSGCVSGPFKATVRGSRIARVTFFVDGKRFKRISGRDGERTQFTVRINPRDRGFGVHRVTARVRFVAASQTQTRTLRLSFQRCRKQVVTPRFTG